MSGIQHLCNHRAQVFRFRTLRDEFQDVVQIPEPLPAPPGLNCRPDQFWSGVLYSYGPGTQQVTRHRWFLVTGFDVGERDILSVTEGPEAPILLRVLSVIRPADPDLAHHIEVNTERWFGALTEPEAVSS